MEADGLSFIKDSLLSVNEEKNMNEDVNDSAIVFVLFVCLFVCFFSVFTMEMFVFNLRIGKTPSSSFIY